ncbi:hypothetical protein [Winogradskyella aquimaris]|uniref:Uncharacterized protein n=1 Tax=Winogradskyella aquimaris TaxID=864074 RepID=A0ABU5EP05_9FLAO|nr:hypothetical protein [Winogradskyella aquimaris]MDY2587786.1 hypothetical protein [Winogradskyella aquimaris]
MKEILKSFFESSKDRIKNPLIGTFIISWIAINWRPITVLLFSDKNVENRINYIENNYATVGTYFLIPFGIALIYVIVLPYFMWAVDELVRKSTIGRKKNLIKQQVFDYEGKQEIAIQESKLEDLKASYRDKADFNKQIEQLRNQLDEREVYLKSQSMELETLKNENEELKKLISDSSKNKQNTQNSIYENQYIEFRESDLYDYFRDVGVKIRNGGEFPHGINEIIKEKYLIQGIVEEVREENNFYYKFSNKGLFFWKKYVNSIRVSKNIKPSDNVDDDLPF